MSDMKLTSTLMHHGVWEGVIDNGGKGVPQVDVHHLGQALEDLTITELPETGQWQMRVQVPVSALSDGVQTFVVSDREDGETIGQFHLIAGEALGDDLRVQVDMLRAELDMLKRAFRRHCAETT